ncbi:MAG TPA: hypothetical protein GXX38_08725 [Clostridia bacterium]|jgi:hypothetical protein|nr:hypothetical protein [Clostridia bacterium]
MLQLDLIGLFITLLFLGPQNIFYVFIAILIHEIGRLVFLILIKSPVEAVVTGGILNSTVLATAEPITISLLITLAGPFFCMITSLFIFRMKKKFLKNINEFINPFCKLDNPWAVINFRFAILSTIFGIIKLLNIGLLR